MSKRFVYFDLGNVLALFEHEIAVRQIASLTSQTTERIREIVFASGLEDRYEAGKLTSKEFVDEINHRTQQSVEADRLLEAHSAIFRPNEAILTALQAVKNSGIEMGILSNTCEAHWRWLQAKKWSVIDGWFEKCALSFEIGSMKPDDTIYEASEELCGCSANEIFFTDDRADNIAAATRRGWATYQYQNTKDLLIRFDDWLSSPVGLY